MTTEIKHGRRADDILEGGSGGEFHRALILAELGSAVEAAESEFAFDTNEPATDLLRLVRDLKSHLDTLAVTEDAEVVLDRTCEACGGSGRIYRGTGGLAPSECDECKGSGVKAVADGA